MLVGRSRMLCTAVIHREEEWYVAECPEIGTASQGETVEAAIENLREATELYLEDFPAKPSSHPIVATFEVAVGA
ncbi:MAG: type II toxin-antitoxin system HicB family antitoxin [Candidatus Sumerlaeota bacterium]|nr:type II toxin-antitoxin system HicB family antitoxin [Candidatus Sumerlaeota bacterium]